ncbi:MAG TPA: hypothetical protein VFB38_12465 [Chthonomonadaceae bacterium]|nr:hypothetical protein [Chthonomonadaceae bacterium]
MSQVLSLRLPDALVERLDRFARRQGNRMTRTKAGLLLLDEALRENEFASIEFRDSPVGRQAYMKDSGLAVWEVILIAQHHEMDAERVAHYFQRPVEWVKAALNYYEAYREEIDQMIEDNRLGYDALKRLLPNLRLVEIPREVLRGEQEL